MEQDTRQYDAVERFETLVEELREKTEERLATLQVCGFV